MDVNTTLFFIFEYILLVIGIIGVIGNVFVIIVFSRKPLRKYAYSFYCLIMAISDICFLTYAFKDWTRYIYDVKLELVGTVVCKLLFLLPGYFDDFSAHLLTIISIDRMISIVYPKRFMVIKKRWFQCLIVAIVSLLVLSRHLIIPIYANITEVNQTNSSQTNRDCATEPWILKFDTIITISIYLIENIILNNWLNIKTIRHIMASRKRVMNGNSNTKNSSLSSRDRKFAVCSISLNLVSMITKLPFFIAFLYFNLALKDIRLVLKITGTITFIENGFSFFINMYVNSLFYEEFLRLFGFIKSISKDIQNNNSVLKSNSNI